jgi:hypothetical protein
VEDDANIDDSAKPALDTLKLPCERSNCLPQLTYTDTSGKAANECFMNHGKPYESDAIMGLKKMGIL